MSQMRVIAAPLLDPGLGRVDMELPVGLTVAEVVAAALPGMAEADHAQLRVSLVDDRGAIIIDSGLWHAVRPKPGVQIVIRAIPAGDALRSILAIVVTIAAVALGGPLAGALQITSQLGVSLVTAGLTVVGNLLVNALIPPPKPQNRENRYQISGWRNPVQPDGAVPVVLGRIRYAPPFAAMSWTEIVGDLQYIRSLFSFGYGPLNLTDFRIGETSLAEYDEVEIEVRQGVPGDLPTSLYPRQIVEENVGAELTRPLPRDDLGEVIEGEPGEETPVVRTTGADASGASVILSFAGGLVKFSDSGKARQHSVSVRIEQRLVTAEEWQPVTQLDITAKKIEGFYRQHSWEFPSRGRWQIRLTMLTDETESSQKQQRCTWAALQTIRPEYPLAFSEPLCLVALRVKATHQLNGALDNFSAIAERPCLDWDHLTETWVSRVTRNPAALYRYVLQSPANPRPQSDAQIDLAQLQDWHDFCRIRGLTYSKVIDGTDITLRDLLAEIAGAGRAAPRHDGLRWGVTVDRPDQPVIDHISPRNSWGFKSTRTYIDPPHAFRVKFQDAENDFKPAEWLVRWPGHTGEIDLTEVLELPGKTDAPEVWREARRRQYEAIWRPDTFEVTQDGPVRVATRGDHIRLSNDILDTVQKAARVRRVVGNLVEIDDAVTMVGGESYAIRWRAFPDPDDTIGLSMLCPVSNEPGETRILTLAGDGSAPGEGDLILFGTAGSESFSLVVTGVEATTDLASIMRMVPVASEIDALLDADEIPAWSSRVGAEIDANMLQPAAPRFVQISSGLSGADAAGSLVFRLEPGSGAITAARFEISHRLEGTASWTVIDMPAANGGGEITGYTAGAEVELRAQAFSFTDVAGPFTAVIGVTIGAGDAPIPSALPADSIVATALLGGATITFGTGADDALARVQLYRSTSAILDRATDAVGAPMDVHRQQTVTLTLGDTTRENLIAGGTMNTPAAWAIGTNWAIAGGLATHTAGAAGSLSQARSLSAGKWYRLSYRTTGVSAGTVAPALTGGTQRDGVVRNSDGQWAERIQAVTGNNALSFDAAAAFSGSIDNVVLYLETSACLDQGIHSLWLEPLSADGAPGPVSGPFSLTIN
ncbi:MAG: phage tail protein [Rhodobacteraceae bacterium GWE1_64_9]|nr:MAG: phage tail protein [Rhodobacteraceae bacterium GWE1_64_9]HBU15724.1 phage tail protein [Gemmobacter sp.]